MHPAKTQISLGIGLVWSESSLCAFWVAKDPSFLHGDSKDSHQTGGRKGHFAGFVMRRLICKASVSGALDIIELNSCSSYLSLFHNVIGIAPWKPSTFQQIHYISFTEKIEISLNVLFLTSENKISGISFSLFRGRQNIFLKYLVLN